MKPVSGHMQGTVFLMDRPGYRPKTFLIWPTFP